jgi:hypothetical protein
LREPRTLKAGVRTELHRLLLALARRGFAAAASRLRAPSPDAAWSAAELEAELAPCLAALGALDTTPRARPPDRSVLLPDGSKRFRAHQKLLAPARAGSAIESMARAAGATEAEMVSVSADEWMFDCIVDLTQPRPGDEPLLELVRIGT